MRNHKSLLAWQEANAVVRTVMATTRGQRHPCVDQLQRAALSVQLNIAEGYAFRSPKRFRNPHFSPPSLSLLTSHLLHSSDMSTPASTPPKRDGAATRQK